MNNKIEHKELPIDQIILLEENPRIITDSELKKLSEDISKDPQFLQQRPSLINHTNGKFYCYAGTQRIKAQKLLGYTHATCFVEKDVPEQLQKERMLKDNLHRGRWDKNKILDLGFEFVELEDIGMDLGEIGLDIELFEEPKDLVAQSKENPPSIKITFDSTRDLQRFQQGLPVFLEENHFNNVSYSISNGEI